MANNILVFIEQRDGKIKKASFEAAKAASDFAAKLGGEIKAVVIGGEVENVAQLGGYGAANVVHIKNSELTKYSSSAYAELLTKEMSDGGFDILFISNTAMGRDLAPRVAVQNNAAAIIDCTAFDYQDGTIVATRPVYAGKALVDVKATTEKKVFTLRPNVFSAGSPSDASATVEVKEVSDVNLKSRVVEEKLSSGKLDVAEADIIVSGGRGMKDAESFKLVEELAGLLGAAVGASRAVVDAGWRPHSEQVGQTGKTVSPSLYVALGISGAIQHLAGMRSSKFIVAVNKDKDAPIFQVADYGIVGDVFDVVPAMIEELKK
ncbi:MAG: electron transfer flavoprotein subunit alpha/FixB family protein [Chlorobi bacterium]|nr:electron transfer flavoprotein subunit alpha/FixB family protein [Chlorobiota bacterium]